jgi:hypothetical protein
MAEGTWRLRLGATVLVVSFLAPALIPVVNASSLPSGWKLTLAGALAAGIPEFGMLLAVAIMGKEGFARFKRGLGRRLGNLAPPQTVSATRYRVGLVLFCAPLLLAWAGPYLGGHLPGYQSHPIAWAIGGDLLLLTGLFVLGGDFWDKLRGLFVHGARVQLSGRDGAAD